MMEEKDSRWMCLGVLVGVERRVKAGIWIWLSEIKNGLRGVSYV